MKISRANRCSNLSRLIMFWAMSYTKLNDGKKLDSIAMNCLFQWNNSSDFMMHSRQSNDSRELLPRVKKRILLEMDCQFIERYGTRDDQFCGKFESGGCLIEIHIDRSSIGRRSCLCRQTTTLIPFSVSSLKELSRYTCDVLIYP